MEITRITKPSFAVIGIEGSTNDGAGFVQRLWAEANSRFGEVAELAKKNAAGAPVGIWGAMSDMGRNFKPWEDGFSKGLYLAGVEVEDGKDALEGWTKWIVPGYEYLSVKVDAPDTFVKMIAYMEENGIALAGAVHDFTDPATGTSYMMFPIKTL